MRSRRSGPAQPRARADPPDHIDWVELCSLERDYVNDENEPGSEMDHVVFNKYRTDKVEEPEK